MRILMPESGYLPMPAEGAIVPWGPYYVQLLRHGDLVEVTTAESPLEVETIAPKIEVTPKPVVVPTTSKQYATVATSGSIPDDVAGTK